VALSKPSLDPLFKAIAGHHDEQLRLVFVRAGDVVECAVVDLGGRSGLESGVVGGVWIDEIRHRDGDVVKGKEKL